MYSLSRNDHVISATKHHGSLLVSRCFDCILLLDVQISYSNDEMQTYMYYFSTSVYPLFQW